MLHLDAFFYIVALLNLLQIFNKQKLHDYYLFSLNDSFAF